jgi:hypothetical protein
MQSNSNDLYPSVPLPEQSPPRRRQRSTNYEFILEPSAPQFPISQSEAPPANPFGRIRSGFRHYNHGSRSYDSSDPTTNMTTAQRTPVESTQFTFQLHGHGNYGSSSNDSEYDTEPIHLYHVNASESEVGRRGMGALDEEEQMEEAKRVEHMCPSDFYGLERVYSPVSFDYSSVYSPYATVVATQPSQPSTDSVLADDPYSAYVDPYQGYENRHHR